MTPGLTLSLHHQGLHDPDSCNSRITKCSSWPQLLTCRYLWQNLLLHWHHQWQFWQDISLYQWHCCHCHHHWPTLVQAPVGGCLDFLKYITDTYVLTISLWCNMYMHVCAFMYTHPSTDPQHPIADPQISKNLLFLELTWTNFNSNLFEDLKSVETPQPMEGCMSWVNGWVDGWGHIKSPKIE